MVAGRLPESPCSTARTQRLGWGRADHPSGLRGGKAMGRIQLRLTWATATLFLAMAGGRAAAEDSVREKTLRLNDITGQDALKGKILELIKDKSELKKIISQATAMAKEKEQPFN